MKQGKFSEGGNVFQALRNVSELQRIRRERMPS